MSSAQEPLEKRFVELSERWNADMAYLSSLGYDHPAYREIIELGPGVVPFLLRDMELNHTHWFGALRAITGVNPGPPGVAGHIAEMAYYWLRWAKKSGYQW